MRAVIQRVHRAKVEILEEQGSRVSGEIGKGVLVLLAVGNDDISDDVQWLASKIAALRIFEDDAGKMNLSLLDVGGDALVVSQFTLFGNVRKGSRPSFNRSAHPNISVPLYEEFLSKMSDILHKPVPSGEFGAMMNVSLINDGPVTIIIDTKDKDI